MFRENTPLRFSPPANLSKKEQTSSQKLTPKLSVDKSNSRGKRPRSELNITGQRTNEEEDTVQHCPDDGQSPVRKRTRVSVSSSKTVLDSLQSLLRFWLSGANLSKDRYLLTKLTNYDGGDGWAPVSLFVTFNKVQELKATETDVAAALSRLQDPKVEIEAPAGSSARFRLQGGASALSVRVTAALRDVDNRTIFLTSVPPVATREVIMKAFGRFGHIQYISIPRQSDSPNRGFAFVEFQSIGSASAAVDRWRREAYSSGQLKAVRAWPHAEWKRRKEARKKRARDRSVKSKPDGPDDKNKDGHLHPSEVTCTADRAHLGSDSTARDNDMVMKAGEGSTSHNDDAIGYREDSIVQEQAEPCPPASQPFLGDYEKGLVIHITGLSSAPRRLKRATLYEALEEHGPVSFVEFSSKQSNECFARYMHVSGAARAISFLEMGDFLGAHISVQHLSGEKEAEYWAKVNLARTRKAELKASQNGICTSRRVEPRLKMNLRNKETR